MAKQIPRQTPSESPDKGPVRVRRGYFECRYGQLHLHNAMPPGGGFEEGTALLCLHDCPGSGRMFAPFLALAGRDRSVYAPDLPGFGESDAPAFPPALGDYVGALGDFLDAMRLRKLDVLGVRAGALLAGELALTSGTRIGRVVMVSAPLSVPGERPAAGVAGDAPPWQRALLEALAQYPARERLARLTQRVLIVRPRDELWDATGRLRELLPTARLLDLDLPGRELLAASPGRLVEAVRDFLRA
jgi:pimeloyl-ACP methyl ester carboxylesterase